MRSREWRFINCVFSFHHFFELRRGLRADAKKYYEIDSRFDKSVFRSDNTGENT